MRNLLKILINVLISTGFACLFALTVIILYTNAKLPSVDILEDIQLQVPLKIYTADGKLIGEYGEKRRTPIKISEVPEHLKLAILATEDRRFYEHNGVDVRGLVRAAVRMLVTGTKEQGASTITMQMARNFFLTRKKTFSRKLNEILLATKIEKELSKDKILELYLNKIYLGKRAYGVQAAALVYYGTTIDKLNLSQLAMIAGLPQAPSAINPVNNPKAAIKRRSHVLKRMYFYGFISEQEYNDAVNAPLTASYHGRVVDIEAPHVAEIARRELVKKYGRKVYTMAYDAYTTVDSRLQTIARHAVQEGLFEYDKRHGYRGPIANFPLDNQTTSNTEPNSEQQATDNTQQEDFKFDAKVWKQRFKPFTKPSTVVPAVVIKINETDIKVLLPNGNQVKVSFETMRWARKQISKLRMGPEPKTPSDVVALGDVIYLQRGKNSWEFSQIPEAQAALVAMHPKNGAILALVGGFDFNLSYFNRATQAGRQPGSNFKPFVYAAALEHGYTAASIINDAPVVYQDDNLEGVWRPQNDSRRFYGPTRLRVGLTKSRNLVSIRLLQSLGVENAIDVIESMGFNKSKLPRSLSLALGSATFSPLEIVRGYGSLANGGYKIDPFVIQRLEDGQNNIVYTANPPTVCPECKLQNSKLARNSSDNKINKIDQLIEYQGQPEEITPADRVLDPQTTFIMTSLLQDAIDTGTGRRAKSLNRHDIAGKTGTTNNKLDAWYSGYNPNLVTTVWVGFDEPRSLKEYGSQAALPIWMKFMGPALKGVPESQPVQPRGLVTVKIDPETGLLARPGQTNAIFEIFRKETVPTRSAPSLNIDKNISITPNSGGGESLF